MSPELCQIPLCKITFFFFLIQSSQIFICRIFHYLDLELYIYEVSCNIEDVPALEKATSARECFKILWKEGIFTPSDIIAMQFLLQATECEELEQKCIKYARMQNAWFYYETPSGIALNI